MVASTNIEPARGSVSATPPSGRGTKRRKNKVRVSKAPLLPTILVWGFAAVSSYPLVWMILQSFRSDGEILSKPFSLPQNPTLDAYQVVFDTTPMMQYFFNSLLVTLAVVALGVACSAGAGYAFSRLRFPGSDGAFAIFIGVLLIPNPVLLLPVFLISGDLGILNSYIGLIGPYVAGALPLGVYLMKTHFDSIPLSFSEAAEMDRATPWQIFRLVMLPLIKPAAATVAVLAFMSAWNEYIYALVSISDTKLFTLPIGLADIAAKSFIYGRASTFAAMVVTCIPVFLAFVVAQRSFIQALTATGGDKG